MNPEHDGGNQEDHWYHTAKEMWKENIDNSFFSKELLDKATVKREKDMKTKEKAEGGWVVKDKNGKPIAFVNEEVDANFIIYGSQLYESASILASMRGINREHRNFAESVCRNVSDTEASRRQEARKIFETRNQQYNYGKWDRWKNEYDNVRQPDYRITHAFSGSGTTGAPF